MKKLISFIYGKLRKEPLSLDSSIPSVFFDISHVQ